MYRGIQESSFGISYIQLYAALDLQFGSSLGPLVQFFGF